MSAMGIRVTVDDRAVLRMLREIERDITPRAEVAALNETAKRLRTAGVREVAASRALPVGIVRQRVAVSGWRRATRAVRRVIITVSYLPVGIHRLKPKETRAGVKAQGGRRFPSGFLAAPRAGFSRLLAFERKGATRYPLEVLKVPIKTTIVKTFDRLVQREGAVIFKRVFEQQMRRFTAKYR